MLYQVWYMKPEQFRDGILFATGKREVTDLELTHIHLRAVEGEDLEDVYYQSQGEIWSPNGEARELIRSKGLAHTSMSVGDVVVDENGLRYVVALCGFELL